VGTVGDILRHLGRNLDVSVCGAIDQIVREIRLHFGRQPEIYQLESQVEVLRSLGDTMTFRPPVWPQLAGRVALPNVTTNQGPPTLYMLGLAMGKDTPDLKAPIDAVGEHRDDIVTFYNRSSQLVQLMEQDEIWAAPVGRFAWAPLRKLNVAIQWATPKAKANRPMR
jgi:hypothetical protein